MRTAVTIAKSTGGDWKILSSPEVAIHEQKSAFQLMRVTRTHAEFSEVRYQESDGIHIVHRFTLSAPIHEQPKINHKHQSKKA